DGVNVAVHKLEQLGNGFQAVAGIFVVYAADAHDRVAIHHAVQYATKQVGVTTETVGGGHGVRAPFQYFANTAHNPFGQQGLTLGYRDLVGGSPVFQQDVNDVLVLHLQLGNLFVQGLGDHVELNHRVLGNQNLVGTGFHVAPQGAHIIQMLRIGRGQVFIRIALGEVVPVAFEVVAGALEFIESLCLSASSFCSVFGDFLRQNP